MKGVISLNKITLLIALAILIILLITGCSPKPPKEPPELKITIGDKKINYVVAKNKWNGSMFDREDTFHTLMKENSVDDIPYIEIGEKAAVSFVSNPPDEFKVSDVLICENGDEMYSYKEIINVPVKYKNGKYYFVINKHLASALSSYYVEDKIDIRGFRMIASWGKNECEYAFVIKTGDFKRNIISNIGRD